MFENVYQSLYSPRAPESLEQSKMVPKSFKFVNHATKSYSAWVKSL